MKYLLYLSSYFLLLNCTVDRKGGEKIDDFSFRLGNVAAFSEMVNAQVKKIALSEPMSPTEMDEFLPFAAEEAKHYNVSLFREKSLMTTSLFPDNVAQNKEVLLLYQGSAKDEYLQLKKRWESMMNKGVSDFEQQIELSRQFGRLLGYSAEKINQLLAENTSFRTLSNFGILANNLFLYYKDLPAASEFYEEIIGLEKVGEFDNANLFRISFDSYLTLVDEKKGMHRSSEAKSVALALLTDDLNAWRDHFKANKVPIKYDLKERGGSAHDGFVAIDPEGYLLEIERFNPHPENENFIPLLARNKQIKFSKGERNSIPDRLQFHSTITWLYHKDVLAMEHFYQNILGLRPVADQGWAKIYQVSKTGFMGIVDELRGMNQYADKKAVNVGFILEDLDGWFNYSSKYPTLSIQDSSLQVGPDSRYEAFTGIGPEKYYYEFDKFYPNDKNQKLIDYLKSKPSL
jgi:catechol 2,3-dioxygenase-like lactoylglutathione lyase family enzyme